MMFIDDNESVDLTEEIIQKKNALINDDNAYDSNQSKLNELIEIAHNNPVACKVMVENKVVRRIFRLGGAFSREATILAAIIVEQVPDSIKELYHEDPEQKFEFVRQISSACKDKFKYKDTDAYKEKVNSAAAVLIARLVEYDPGNCDRLVTIFYRTDLFIELLSSKNPEYQRNAVDVLLAIAQHHKNSHSMLLSTFDNMLSIAKTADDATRAKAIKFLVMLRAPQVASLDHSECCAQLLVKNAVEDAVKNLGSEDVFARQGAARVLGFIAKASEEGCQAVVASGAMEPLFAMLETHPKEVLHAFAALARHGNQHFFEFVGASDRFEVLRNLELNSGDKQIQRDMVTVLARFLHSKEREEFFAAANSDIGESILRKVIPMLKHADNYDVVVLLSRLAGPDTATLMLNRTIQPNMPTIYLFFALAPKNPFLSNEEKSAISKEVRLALRRLVPAILNPNWLEGYNLADDVFDTRLNELVSYGVVSHQELATNYREQLDVFISSSEYPKAKQFAATCLCALDEVDSDHVKWLELLTETYITSLEPEMCEEPVLVESFERLGKRLAASNASCDSDSHSRVIESLVDILKLYGNDVNVQALVVKNLNAMISKNHGVQRKKVIECIKFNAKDNPDLVNAIIAKQSKASLMLKSCVPTLGIIGTIRSVAQRFSSAQQSGPREMVTKPSAVSAPVVKSTRSDGQKVVVQGTDTEVPSWFMAPDNTGSVVYGRPGWDIDRASCAQRVGTNERQQYSAPNKDGKQDSTFIQSLAGSARAFS